MGFLLGFAGAVFGEESRTDPVLGSSELLPAGTGAVRHQLSPRVASPGAAASLRFLSTIDGEAAFTLGASPIGLTFTASTDEWLGARVTFDAGSTLDAQCHALAAVDVFGMAPRGYSWEPSGFYWRGAIAAELGWRVALHDCDVLLLARFGSYPSAQLWESTSNSSGVGATSRSDDWGYVFGAGFRVNARPDSNVRVDFAMVCGASFSAPQRYALVGPEWIELALSAAWQFSPGWWLAAGMEGTPAAGPRASPLDLRSVALSGRVFVGIEWRAQ